MQEYLYKGNENTNTSILIFKARAQKLDIKMHKKWKYDDTVCVGCGQKDETGEEILTCIFFDYDGKKTLVMSGSTVKKSVKSLHVPK